MPVADREIFCRSWCIASARRKHRNAPSSPFKGKYPSKSTKDTTKGTPTSLGPEYGKPSCGFKQLVFFLGFLGGRWRRRWIPNHREPNQQLTNKETISWEGDKHVFFHILDTPKHYLWLLGNTPPLEVPRGWWVRQVGGGVCTGRCLKGFYLTAENWCQMTSTMRTLGVYAGGDFLPLKNHAKSQQSS